MTGIKKQNLWRISLGAQCLGLHASSAGCVCLIPAQGTVIPHAKWCSTPQNFLINKSKKQNLWKIQQ